MQIVEPKSSILRVIGAHLFLISFILITLFPLLMIVSISFRPGNLAVGSLFPDRLSLEHWQLALGIPYTEPDGKVIQPPFPVLLWLWNSVKIASIAGFLVLALATVAAYAFARMRFAGRDLALKTVLLIQMFPAVLALVSIYALFDKIGTYIPWLGIDSHGAVILASLGGITMHLWTIKAYFETIDPAIERAAMIDGASPFQTFTKILLPISVPVLVVVFVLAFIGVIIDYPISSVLLQSQEKLTLAVGSRLYLYEQNYLWGDFAAAAVLSGIPITIVFLIGQRWLVSGLTAGGVKG